MLPLTAFAGTDTGDTSMATNAGTAAQITLDAASYTITALTGQLASQTTTSFDVVGTYENYAVNSGDISGTIATKSLSGCTTEAAIVGTVAVVTNESSLSLALDSVLIPDSGTYLGTVTILATKDSATAATMQVSGRATNQTMTMAASVGTFGGLSYDFSGSGNGDKTIITCTAVIPNQTTRGGQSSTVSNTFFGTDNTTTVTHSRQNGSNYAPSYTDLVLDEDVSWKGTKTDGFTYTLGQLSIGATTATGDIVYTFTT